MFILILEENFEKLNAFCIPTESISHPRLRTTALS